MADSPRIEELRRRVQVDPASIAFAALAEEYRRAGRFDEAIATCTAGLQRHPAYLSAHVTLGRALIEVGRYDEAREELEHVLRVAPENLAAIRGLAEIHHRRGELPESHEPLPAPGLAVAPPAALAMPAAPVPDAAPPAFAAPQGPAAPPPVPASIAPPPRVPAATASPDMQAETHHAAPVVLPPSRPAPPPDPALAPLETLLASIVALRGERAARG
jgi:tetratricopeptide (TPR) repeat protein